VGGACRKENVMNRTSLVLVILTVVLALGGTRAAAQNTRAESASQERAAKAQTSLAVDESGAFQRAFTWIGNRMEGSGGAARDGLYPELSGMIPPVRSYFRRETGNTWTLVGFERLQPE
jgi:hypothetical protein